MVQPTDPGYWYRAALSIEANVVSIPNSVLTVPPDPEEETAVILIQMSDSFFDLFLYSPECIPPTRRGLETLFYHHLPGVLDSLGDIFGQVVFSVPSHSFYSRGSIPIVGSLNFTHAEDDGLPF